MKRIYIICFAILLIFYGCGDGEQKEQTSTNDSSRREKIAEKFGLTMFELDNGIGPIKEKIELVAIDSKLAEKGKEIFTLKCTQCHKLDETYTGPALRGVTERRTPEYIMNMILNPEEMTKRHPEAKKLLGIHANQMTFQNVTQEDVRALLEYLRMESNN